MCAVSMIMDHYQEKWTPLAPVVPIWPQPTPSPWPIIVQPAPAIPQEEIDEFRRLLERAREYDRRMGQPDCELDEKRRALKTLAEQLGVEIAFL